MKTLFIFLCSCLLLSSCHKEKPEISKITGKRININDTIPMNEEIDAFIKPYRDQLNDKMHEVLSYSPKDMHKNDGFPETMIGNFMSDMLLEQAQEVFKKRTGNTIDFCLLNHGGIRAPIAEGPIKMLTAFQVMPFENEAVVAELTAENVKKLFEYLVREKRAHPIAGATLKMTEDGKDYKMKEFLINGKPLDMNKTYFVLTSDYLQNGGDRMTFLANPVSLHVLDYKIRNAMIDYFKKTDTIPARNDGRFAIIK